ncbi:stage V sporulation protein B [Alicyclobacillus ferrooxydans]|uniref:Stage V sporulation protein B n=1 Tax=Alicyclobacillus ferrooxydans TaxID=471514 RepID=A0A0P9CGW8_9BACL|nr:stage V sporulation protein B [Alicyclobacillus ferrooxydans]KPV42276.1 stage V sporulation protein B [Alicyclobacillus ferrooxydans]
MSQRSFFHGAMVLIAASLVTRVMGFAYRIVLTRMIGAAGMGLFQMVFSVLSLVLTFVTAGLPTAISKLVAEAVVQRDRVRVERILKVSAAVILTMAALFTALMWFGRRIIFHYWLTDPRAYPTYLCMIPIVAVIAVSSIYRGYFQGLQDMSPPAWASILEQTVRIISVWILAAYFIHYSLSYAAAAAMMGMVLGELAGLLFMIVSQRYRGRLSVILADAPTRSLETARQTLHAIVDIAGPVTLSRLIGSLLFAVEPVLVTRSLLAAGITTDAATALYGQYGGMAIPLLVFPTVFTSSLAVNLVPAVSEAIADNHRSRVGSRLNQSFLATALVGFPASVVLTLFAEPLCRIIFGESSVGPILTVMAPSGFLLYLQGPLTGILQGLNRAGTVTINHTVGGVLRLVLVYLLASQPRFGILGVALAVTISIAVTTGLDIWSIQRMIGFPVNWMDTWKSAVATLVTLAVLTILVRNPGTVTAGPLAAAIFAAAMVYFVLLCAFGVLTVARAKRLPKIGNRLARLVSWMPFAH